MNKGAVLAILGLLSVCSALPAQEGDFDTITRDSLQLMGEIDIAPALALNRPDLFSTVNGHLLLHSLPVTTFLDGRRFPISGDSNRMEISPLELIPVAFLSSVRVQQTSTSPLLATDAPGGIVDLRLRQVSSGGEAGVFYGSSSGRYGREDFSAYILGGVGTEKFQISAGAAYENSNGRVLSYRH